MDEVPSDDGPLGDAADGGGGHRALDETPPSDERRLQKALHLAYAHVNRRERTTAEVRAHLERKGISVELADAAVEALVEQQLLDDARFAEMFVSDKRELQQWGDERIRRGLRSCGIDRALAERALAADDDDEQPTQLQRALDLLRRRFPDPPRDRRERDRALGVLVRKGYESELALDALAAHAHGD